MRHLKTMSHSFDWRCDACERPSQHDFAPGNGGDGGAATTLTCDSCGHSQSMAEGSFADGKLVDPLQHCIACSSSRLYSQKDFNRKLGVAIVLVGAVLSPWTYGLSLVAFMGFDYALYYVVPEITVCYACDAIHRGFEHNPAHRAHDPVLSERFRREARQEVGLDPAPEEDVEAGGGAAPTAAD